MHIHTQHQQELCEAREKHNILEINHNQLTCQLQESQKQIETYKVRICPSPCFTLASLMFSLCLLYTHFHCTFQLGLEALTIEKDGLQKNVSDIQESHDVQIKENNRRHEENLKHVQQQVGRCNIVTMCVCFFFFNKGSAVHSSIVL